MRSYEAARGLLGFLGFLAWCAIIVGVVIAIGAGSAVSQTRSFGVGGGAMAGMMAAMPGLILAFLGFLALAQVQMGRAGVDTAEYTQQMLKIARDQLEVSRQAARQGDDPKKSFGTLQPEAGFPETLQQKTATASFDGADKSNETPIEVSSLEDQRILRVEAYQSEYIHVLKGGYAVGGLVYPTLGEAKAMVDEKQLGHTDFAPRTSVDGYEPGETITYRTKKIRVVAAGFVFGAQTYTTLDEAKAKVDAEGHALPPEPQLTRPKPDPVAVDPLELSASFKRS